MRKRKHRFLISNDGFHPAAELRMADAVHVKEQTPLSRLKSCGGAERINAGSASSIATA
jgi:hypothetical protein